jgi:DNA-binding NarL/FixJ family response regulator
MEFGADFKTRILVVDDHPIVRVSIAALLNSRWGYRICGEASDGVEAIEKVRQLRPDLVLLDLNMPVMDGTAAARQIRLLVPATKIVLLSMHDSETIAEQGRLAGADASLSKNCPIEALHNAIVALFKVAQLSSSAFERTVHRDETIDLSSQEDEFEIQRKAFFGL